MDEKLLSTIRTDFRAFVEKAFHEVEGGRLIEQPYIEYLCHRLSTVAPGILVINLPPRHLKTFIGSVCLAAWTLAHNPATRIMVVAGSENLAKEISRKVRGIIRSTWFGEAFPRTRVSKKDKSGNMDFAVGKHGGLYATSILGNFTGRGAHLIIVDDPLDIRDACNLEKIDQINSVYDNVIVSRLNKANAGTIVIVMHRLHDNDLCGQVFEQGGCDRIVLPLVARRRATYDLGYDRWIRHKGDLLRPDAYSPKKVRKLVKTTKNPDFELLYQQNPLGNSFPRLKRSHFDTFSERPALPIVLSIDPSLVGGHGSSYSVIQAWCSNGGQYFLVDQWREQCTYPILRASCWRMVRRHRPATILVERTGNGPALISELRRQHVVEVTPRESKLERFRKVCGLMRGKKVKLLKDAPWLKDFLDELVGFPAAATDDQTDAATQALNWFLTKPLLEVPPARGLMVLGNRHAVMSGTETAFQGGVMAPGRSVTGASFGGYEKNGPFIEPKVWVTK